MGKKQYTLIVDKEGSEKLSGYLLYRSGEREDNRPIINGVHIQRSHLASQTPNEITITLEWELKNN